MVVDENITQLSEDDKLTCEGPITKQEGKVALTKMARNKTAGISGFTAEFFAFFWDVLGDIIVDYFNDAKDVGELFISNRRGILTLIPKKGNQMELKNKRPICLLDVLYKLIAKVIAIRLSKVIHKIVHRNQTGFIKGRYIGENLRTISDIIEYCDMDNVNGILLTVDFRTAFDSLEHDFMMQTLKAFNFGPDFLSWIRLLYSGASLTVKNNGFTSEWFPCTKGTFQGSPLSGLIFDLASDIFASKIRSANSVKGVKISNQEIKIMQYADDTTISLGDEQSVQQVMEILEEFKKTSGLEINVQKSSVMRLGSCKHDRTPICGIEAVAKVKILGVWFSATEQCNDDNIDPIIRNIKNVTNSWQQRNLTIKGRIVIAKSLLASQLVYVALCSKIGNVNLKEIQSLIMKFIWRGRPPKVAKKPCVKE